MSPLPQLLWTALSTITHLRLTDATVSQEVVVSYLPLSHIAAQMVDMWITMRIGGLTHFAQPDALKVRSEANLGAALTLTPRRVQNQHTWVCVRFSQGSLVNTMKEAHPTAFMGVPRVWEKMQERMKAIGAKSSAVRKKVAAWAKDVGLHNNMAKMNQYVHVTTGRLMLMPR